MSVATDYTYILIEGVEYKVDLDTDERDGSHIGFIVESPNTPAVYGVKTQPGQHSCTCNDYKCRLKKLTGATCKHIRGLRDAIADGELPEPGPLQVCEEFV